MKKLAKERKFGEWFRWDLNEIIIYSERIDLV